MSETAAIASISTLTFGLNNSDTYIHDIAGGPDGKYLCIVAETLSPALGFSVRNTVILAMFVESPPSEATIAFIFETACSN